ncbi:MAG: ATP synthase F1 subunit epsilon [Myxococcota bacterium]|jgi:F-type H+-transporting ATPase subunit epsilon
MATQLQVQIVTPERSVFTGKASEVVLPAWGGELGVLPDHDALLCLLRAGVCRVYNSDGVVGFVVGRGFAEVGPDRVTLLTDSAEEVGKVDKSQASKDLAFAEAEMVAHEGGSEKLHQAQVLYELARARLDA